MITAFLLALTIGQEPTKPVVVKFHEPKTVAATESSVPIDPTLRVNIQGSPGMAYGLNAENVRLTFSNGSARTTFKIDGQIIHPNSGLAPLPAKTPTGKARNGFYAAHQQGKLTITWAIEAVPSKPAKPGDPRKLNTALIRYIIENKDSQPHTVETRVRIDTYCNNDGALFAAPTYPRSEE